MEIISIEEATKRMGGERRKRFDLAVKGVKEYITQKQLLIGDNDVDWHALQDHFDGNQTAADQQSINDNGR